MNEQAMMKKMKMIMGLGFLFALTGFVLHITALTLEFGTFAPMQEAYWSLNKATRDTAATGSALNQQLVEIKNFPPKLMTLKLIGVGSILIGIFLVLMGILKALTMMPARLGTIICPACKAKIKGKKK